MPLFIKSYKSAILLLFGALLVLTVGAITRSNYLRTTPMVLDLSYLSIEQAAALVVERTARVLETIRGLVAVNGALLSPRGILADQDRLLPVYWQQLRLCSQVVAIYAADGQGNLVLARNAPRLATRVIDRSGEAAVERTVYRDADFRAIAHITGDAAFDPRTRPWYTRAVEQPGVTWSSIYLFAGSGEPGLTASRQVLDERGQLLAVIGADLTLERLSGFLSDQRIARGVVSFIADRAGRLIAYPHQIELRKAKEENETSPLPRVEDLADRPLVDAYKHTLHRGREDKLVAPSLIGFTTEGTDYVVQVLDIPGDMPDGWRLYTVVARQDLLATPRRIYTESLVIAWIILVVALLAMYTLASRFFEPIRRLARNTELIKALRIDEVQPVKSRFQEIRAMDNAIQNMKKALGVFRQYIPKELMQRMVESGRDIELGGQTKDISLFVSGTSDFAAICDKWPAQEITEVLAMHLDAFSDITDREQGTIETLRGDLLIALWNAPLEVDNGTERACRTALLCKAADDELSQRLHAAGHSSLTNTFLVHCGPAIVGNIGSSSRKRYAAIGATVEVALALRPLNHYYGTRILITEPVYRQVVNQFACRILDRVEIGESRQVLTLYGLLGDRGAPLSADVVRYVRAYEQAFELYSLRQWDEALEIFRGLAAQRPLDKAVGIMIERCESLRCVEHGTCALPAGWDGSVKPALLS